MPATLLRKSDSTKTVRNQRKAIRLHQPAPKRRSLPIRQSATRRRDSAIRRFFGRPFGIEKAVTVLAFLVATSLSVLCALDLTIAWPWMQASKLFDWGFLSCGLVLLGLTFDVFRDQAGVRRASRYRYSSMGVDSMADNRDTSEIHAHAA